MEIFGRSILSMHVMDSYIMQCIATPHKLTKRTYVRNSYCCCYFQILLTATYAHFTSFFALAQNHDHQVVLDIVEKLDGENPREGHRTTIEHAGFFTQAQVIFLLPMWRSFLF